MTEPVFSGTCNKCHTEYEVWGFDEYGNSRLCGDCDVELRELDVIGLPEYTKPLNDREEEIIELITTEKRVNTWETKWRCYLYWE